MSCPSCGTINNDNWPLNVNGKIVWGGCQDCWEKQCDIEFSKMLNGVEIGFKRVMEKL